VHTDAAQSVGKVRTKSTNWTWICCRWQVTNYMPEKAIGVLFVRQNVDLRPVLHGAVRERLRPGTENVPTLSELGAAARLAAKEMRRRATAWGNLRDVCALLAPSHRRELTVKWQMAPRLQKHVERELPRVAGNELLARVPEICASTEPRATQRHIDVRHVCHLMGLSALVAKGTVAS